MKYDFITELTALLQNKRTSTSLDGYEKTLIPISLKGINIAPGKLKSIEVPRGKNISLENRIFGTQTPEGYSLSLVLYGSNTKLILSDENGTYISELDRRGHDSIKYSYYDKDSSMTLYNLMNERSVDVSEGYYHSIMDVCFSEAGIIPDSEVKYDVGEVELNDIPNMKEAFVKELNNNSLGNIR